MARQAERLALGVIGGVFLALIIGTQLRNHQYSSPALLWMDVLNHDPGNYRALWSFADIMNELGRESETFALADKALERKPTCDVYNRLAAVHLQKGNYDTAERFCRRGLEHQLAVLPPDDRAVLCTQGDLATALRMHGKIAEADAICTAMPSMRRVLGANHQATLGAEQIMAEGLAERGDYQAAETLARDVLARARKIRGWNDPIAINAAVALARVLDKSGRSADAERVIQEALDTVIRQGSRRENDRMMLEDLAAEFLERDGRIDEAVAIRRRQADLLERLRGKDHPLTSSARIKYVLSTAAQADARGNYAQAAEIYARFYESYKQSLGADHSRTRDIESKLNAARSRAASAPPPSP